jgi:hypothetical protein
MALEWEGRALLHADQPSLHMGKDGKCIVPALPAGTYSVRYRLNGRPGRDAQQEKTFTVTDNMTVNLTG